MSSIIKFFDSPFFIIMGGLSTVLMICGFVYTAILVLKGVIPVWYRLGMGLSRGKIAIFASEEFESLKSMMIDSKIFKEKNIIRVNKDDIKKSEKANIFLVHWKDFQHKMTDILAIKKDHTALVVYAPQIEGLIQDQDILDKINSHRNSIIVNFRGRLLNDILTSLITASYE